MTITFDLGAPPVMPVVAQAQTVPLPRVAGRDELAAVAAVDDLIRATLQDLSQLWQDLSPAGSPVDQRRGRLEPESVLQLLQDFAGSGGKRLRPRMAYWGWVAGGGARTDQGHDEMVTVGAALELLHAFALVHDDVMDDSDERRGRPAVHVRARQRHQAAAAARDAHRYGESIAILVGDLLHSEADALAARLPAAMRSAWRTMSIELMAGQARDLVGAANSRRDLDHARQVAAMKSGAYTVWRPLQLGALAARAGTDTRAALRTFGLRIGEAFALRDDVLGVLGDRARTGKPVGDDIVAGKPTVLMALAEQRFTPPWRRALRDAGTPRCTPERAAELAAEMVRCGVVDEVEDLITAAVAAGCAALADPSVEPAAVAGLRALAHRVAWRDS